MQKLFLFNINCCPIRLKSNPQISISRTAIIPAKILHCFLLNLFFIITLFCCGNLVAAEEKSDQTQEMLIAESRSLVDEIDKLAEQSAAMKKSFSEIPEVDRILFLELIFNLEEGLRSKLDRLIEIQKQLETDNVNTVQLQGQIKSVIADQSKVIQEEVKALTGIIQYLREEESQKTGDQDSRKLSLERIRKEMDDLLQAWQKNIELGKSLNMNVQGDNRKLNQILQIRALSQAGSIRLDLDHIKTLKKRMDDATEEEQKNIEQHLREFELNKDATAKSLETMISLMNKQGLETTRFGQVLVVATGEILNENVGTEAIIGLFQQLVNKSMRWLDDNLPLIIFRLISFVLILFVFSILAGILRRLVDRAASLSKSDLASSQLLKNFLGSITSKTVMLIGIIIALSQLGIEIGPLLAGMGVMGFVVGFALQDSLSNFASGIMILVYRPFDVGDVVEAGGVMGKVNDMSLVSTTILTFDNQELVVPNTKIWGNIIRNVTSQDRRRIDLTAKVGHDVDIDRVEDILNEIIAADDRILTDPPPLVRAHNITDYAIEFVIRPWAITENYWPIYWELTKAIKTRLDAEGISFPHPKQDIFIQEHPEKLSNPAR